jgi:hypothetical protein
VNLSIHPARAGHLALFGAFLSGPGERALHHAPAIPAASGATHWDAPPKRGLSRETT